MNGVNQEQSAGRRAVHAYMLAAAQRGLALREASLMAARLMCLSPESGEACGKCKSCTLLLAGNHPDYLFILPKKEGGSIGVEEVRQIIPKLYTMPFISPMRLIVFSAADSMTVQAQNALLKVLEEPPDGNVFLLPLARERALIETVRSRCRRIWVRPEPTSGVPEGMEPSRYRASLRLAGGVHDSAEALAGNEAFFAGRANIFAGFLAFTENPARQAAYLSGTLKAQPDKKAAVELLMSLVRDAGAYRAGLDIEGIINTDCGDAVRVLALSQDMESLLGLFSELSTAAEHLEMNASAQLAVDGLCVNMLEVLAR